MLVIDLEFFKSINFWFPFICACITVAGYHIGYKRGTIFSTDCIDEYFEDEVNRAHLMGFIEGQSGIHEYMPLADRLDEFNNMSNEEMETMVKKTVTAIVAKQEAKMGGDAKDPGVKTGGGGSV